MRRPAVKQQREWVPAEWQPARELEPEGVHEPGSVNPELDEQGRIIYRPVAVGRRRDMM